MRIFNATFVMIVASFVLSACGAHQSVKLNTPEQLESGDTAVLAGSYLKAILAEGDNDIETASTAYFDALAEQPHNLDFLDNAFKYELANGNIEQALALAERFSELSEPHPIVLLLMSVQAAHENDLKAAERALKEARKQSPRLLQFELVDHYLNIANGGSIEKNLKKLRAYEPHPSLAAYHLFHVARMQEMLGDTEATIAAYEEAYAADAKSIFTTLHLGTLYELNGDTDKAMTLYRDFEHHHPNTLLMKHVHDRLAVGTPPTPPHFSLNDQLADVMFGFGTLMSAQRIVLAAKQMMQMAIYLNQEHPFAPFYLAILEEQSGRDVAAFTLYKQIEAGAPTWLGAQVRMAEIDFRNTRKQESFNRLQNLLKDDHTQDAINLQLAEKYYLDEQFERAIRYYSRVLNKIDEPHYQHARLFFARGAAHERLKNFDAAAEDMIQSLSLNPHDPTVLNYLGYMWVDRGENLQKAFTLIGKALILRPDDGAITDSLGWAYYKLGDYDNALRYLERAAEMLPDDAVVNAHLGDVYAKFGRLEEAQKQWQRALDIGLDDQNEVERLQKAIQTAQPE